jgi:hypothetical protein
VPPRGAEKLKLSKWSDRDVLAYPTQTIKSATLNTRACALGSRERRTKREISMTRHQQQLELFHNECCAGGGYECRVVRAGSEAIPERRCLACRVAPTSVASAFMHVLPAGEESTLCMVVGFCERCSAKLSDEELRMLAEAHCRELRLRAAA